MATPCVDNSSLPLQASLLTDPTTSTCLAGGKKQSQTAFSFPILEEPGQIQANTQNLTVLVCAFAEVAPLQVNYMVGFTNHYLFMHLNI